MKVYQSITELIGHTPLLALNRFSKAHDIHANIIAKLEYFNPTGSVKDRAALSMIEDAESKGLLRPGSVIIEPTSGNTGIGLAAVAASRGYRTILTMPETMSVERQKLLKAYGAEVVLTKGSEGMAGSVEKAKELQREIPGSFIPGQFSNMENPAVHVRTTGPEIWQDTDGNVDVFIAGVGTGGTLSGVGKYLKDKNPAIEVIAVEPEDSPLLSKGCAGSHGIQGIGANFVPDTLDREVYNKVIAVKLEDAYSASRLLAKEEGILAGISAGAALSAAVMLGRCPEYYDKTMVVLLPDTGERYLSTEMF